MPDTPIIITEEMRIEVMRQAAARGGRNASGDKKKRPQAHYEKLAKEAREKKRKRDKLRASLGL